MRGCYVRPGHMLSDLSYTLGTRPLMNDVPHEEEGLHDTEVERQVQAKQVLGDATVGQRLAPSAGRRVAGLGSRAQRQSWFKSAYRLIHMIETSSQLEVPRVHPGPGMIPGSALGSEQER